MKRYLAIILAIFFVFPTASFIPVSANTLSETENELVLGSFENGQTDGWTVGDNAASALSTSKDLETALSNNPAYAAKGGYFLEVKKSAAPATTKSYTVKNFSTPLDLSSYQYIGFSFWGWGGTSTTYYIEVVLTSFNGDNFTDTITCNGGIWMSASVDLSEYQEKNNISSIKIGYYGSDLAYFASNWQGCFSLDDIKATVNQPVATSDASSLSEKALANFDSDAEGFTSGDNAHAVAFGSFSNNTACLEAAKNGVPPTIISTIKKNYAVGSELNLSEYNIFSMDATCWGGAAEKYVLTLTLISSDGSSYTNEQYILSDNWSTVVYDISGFKTRNKISEIRIGFSCAGEIVPAAAAGWEGHFFIDSIKATANSIRLFNFEYNSACGWTAGSNIYSNVCRSTTGIQPYPTSGTIGTNYLTAQKQGAPDTHSSVVRNFGKPLDLSNFTILGLDFFNHGGASTTETYGFELTLTGQSGSKTYSVTVAPNKWNCMRFDLSNFEGRNAITKMSITFYTLNPNAAVPDWNGSFFIDNIVAAGVISTSDAGSTQYILTNFENGLDGWKAGECTNKNETPIKTTAQGYYFGEAIGYIPSAASQGSNMLHAVKEAVLATTPSYVVKRYPIPADLSGCTSLLFDMFGYGGASSAYEVKVRLTAENGQKKEYNSAISSDGWRQISIDLTEFSSRDSIISIEIGYCGTDTLYTGDAGWVGQFFIDNIRAEGNVSYSNIHPVELVNFSLSEDRILTNIAAGTTAEAFMAILNPASDVGLAITKSGTVLTNNQKIGTGTTVTVTSGGKSTTFTIVIYGDVDCDGEITALDVIKFKNHLLSKSPLDDIALIAGGIAGSSGINIDDLLTVKNSVINNIPVNQNIAL